MKKLTFGIIFLLLLAVAAAAQNQGFPLYGSFESGSFDSVNRQDLNSTFGIPIVSGQARGLGFAISLNYNSLLWQQSSGAWVTGANGTWKYGWSAWPVGSITDTSTSNQCTPPLHGVIQTISNFGYIDQAGTRHGFSVT